MKYEHVIVDGMNLFFKSYHKQKNYHQYSGIINFMLALKNIESLCYTDHKVHIVWDVKKEKSESSSRRKHIYPDYKINRTASKFTADMENVFNRLREILVHYSDNLIMYENPEFEADDFFPEIIKQIREDNKNASILLASEDSDTARSIDMCVDWFAKGRFFNMESYKEEFGYYPSRNKIILHKAIKGDTSDNIKRAIDVNINKVDLLTILDNISSLDELINVTKLNIPLKLKDSIIRNMATIKLNWSIIDFLEFDDYDLEICKIPCTKNDRIIKEMYNKLAIDFTVFDPELKEVKGLVNDEIDLFSNYISRV